MERKEAPTRPRWLQLCRGSTRWIGRLVAGLDERGLGNRVNLIVVSDRGMSDVSLARIIVLDDYIYVSQVRVLDPSPEPLRGRRVLVVGGGNSGCDIAVDAATHADRAAISLRRGYHFVPKHILGGPATSSRAWARRCPAGWRDRCSKASCGS